MEDFSVSSTGEFSVSFGVSSVLGEEAFGIDSTISISDNVSKL